VVAHPLFVAQDPNLLWPLILSHGCIRAALEYVAPHVDWDARLGNVVPVKACAPLIDGATSGTILRRCGADVCLNLEMEESKGKFSLCSRCRRRRYCSVACQRSDWFLHKAECSKVATPPKPAPPLPEATPPPKPVLSPPAATVDLSGLQLEGFEPNEEVILHSLVAKHELNNHIGIVCGERRSDNRYPIKVAKQVLSIKACNFHRHGVRVEVHSSSGVDRVCVKKLVCSAHNSECCDVCCLDFGITNHLLAIQRSRPKEPLCKAQIESTANSHFAKVPRAGSEDGEWSTRGLQDGPGVSMDAVQGLHDQGRRVVMCAALKVHSPSLVVAAAIAGMGCFGACANVVARGPEVVGYLETVLALCAANKVQHACAPGHDVD